MVSHDNRRSATDPPQRLGAEEAARYARLPHDVLALCTERGLLRPNTVDGKPIYSQGDLLRLKLLRYMLWDSHVQQLLRTCQLRLGRQMFGLMGTGAVARYPGLWGSITHEVLRRIPAASLISRD